MPDVGNDVDDRPAMRLHPAVVGLAHEDEAARKVAAHHGLEALGGDGLHGRSVLASGVVHQSIQTPTQGQHIVDGLTDHGLVADIAGVHADVAAVFHDLGAHGFQFFWRASDERHVSTECAEFVGRAATEPAAAAGYDDG